MVIELIIWIMAIYLAAGFLFAIPFALKGASRIDEAAIGASWGFRLIIVPGAMVFWPLLWKKWVNATKKRGHE